MKNYLGYLRHTNLELKKVLTYANLPESQTPTAHAGVNSEPLRVLFVLLLLHQITFLNICTTIAKLLCLL